MQEFGGSDPMQNVGNLEPGAESVPAVQWQKDPALELPKGGGAIRGISEKFSANPTTGTASLSIPIPISPARGFQPELSLHYDSGQGNSPFGLGWNVNLPSVTRSTSKQLPQYDDANDSDVYVLSDAEDLVPFLKQDQNSTASKYIEQKFTTALGGIDWEVKQYRPRIDNSFSKIERWRDVSSERIWWRTVSTTNVTSVYGFSGESCVHDPQNPSRIYQWFIDFSYDDKGDFTCFKYSKEDGDNLSDMKLSEQHRNGHGYAQTYLKKVLYGIKSSWIKHGLTQDQLFGHTFSDDDFHFQTILDYGDHPGDIPESMPTEPGWVAREDPFSDYKSGFEVRTYRQCKRVLLFHDFPEHFNHGPELIRSLDFEYNFAENGFSILEAARIVGYQRSSDGSWINPPAAFPPMTFAYQRHLESEPLSKLALDGSTETFTNVDNQRYQWIDLYNEGLTGVATQHLDAVYYAQNQGNGRFSGWTAIATSPSLKGNSGPLAIHDLEGNGVKSLVATNGSIKGYYGIETAGDAPIAWNEFVPFGEMPRINFNDPNLRIIDLNGNGKADIFISEDHVARWYPSKGKMGYDESREVTRLYRSDQDPEVIFSNQVESIFTADMSGDGLSDIVRIRNGEVVYWPNIGYGRFGAKVSMDNAPVFHHSDLFTPNHIRLADIDGSGTTDIVYLGKSEFQYWINQSGNGWSTAIKTLNPFPEIDNFSAVSVMDLLGTGTACVVWSSPLPGDFERSIRYIDLMAGKKPYLLQSFSNGFGTTVNLDYTPSTRFYLDDKANGEPWITKLHFPVHCLSKVETIDNITGARFANTYSYHHGYYDHAEREFRGFGRVDQIKSEAYEHFAQNASSNALEPVFHQTPVLIKTWFNTGAYLDQEKVRNQYLSEYCSFQDPGYDHLNGFALQDPSLPENLSAAEWRESLRACKGMVLRTETFGLDGSGKEPYPFSIVHNTCTVNKLQPKSTNKYGVFQVINSESITISLDRNVADPRIAQSLVLSSNEYGQPLLSAVVNYGRRLSGPSDIEVQQKTTQCMISEAQYTLDEFGLLGGHDPEEIFSHLRSPVEFKSTSYEIGLDWNWNDSQGTGGIRYSGDALLELCTNQSGDLSDVAYLRVEADNDVVQARPMERRLLGCAESRFANESLDGALPSGRQSALGIGWNQYQMAFTDSLAETIYGDKVSQSDIEAAGYVHLNGDNHWWVSSGHPIFHRAHVSEDISHRFFTPYGTHDANGAAIWQGMDDYMLLPVKGSVSRAGYENLDQTDANFELNKTEAVNDYRTLGPKFLCDENGNWSGVEFDGLGLVVKSAVMGKVANATINNPPEVDAVTEGDNLQNPSAIIEYGFYQELTDGHKPAWARSVAYVNHFADQQIPREQLTSRLDYIEQFEYSDGSGNVVMTKSQSEPGWAKQLQQDGSVVDIDTRIQANTDRWLGTGRTIVNNVGNPVRQYEPYFSVSSDYESEQALVETGISVLQFYDAAGRNICTLNPNQTYEKVLFDGWKQVAWDVNDTLYLPQADGSKITDIRLDPDVGHLLAQLPEADVLPSWYEKRINALGTSSADQKKRDREAAVKTEPHVATPSETYSDAMGRSIHAVAHNRILDQAADGVYIDEKSNSYVSFDIEGSALSVVDARNNAVMAYRYSMLAPSDQGEQKLAVYQHSMDGGDRWFLYDIQGNLVKSWDSREQITEFEFDSLNRLTGTWVEHEGSKKLVERTVYRDSDDQDQDHLKANNLIGVPSLTYDQSGRNQILIKDFKDNVLQASKTISNEYKTTVDWFDQVEQKLDSDQFVIESTYDALNRVVYAESPRTDATSLSKTIPKYGESGSLNSMSVETRGQEKIYVEALEYDARGQRTTIKYGNGVRSDYHYEADTYRLRNLVSTKGNEIFQDIHYCYDPVGNITETVDTAQEVVYFDGVETRPVCAYQYDSLYRLIFASGREHIVQANCPHPTQGWQALNGADSSQLQNYEQRFAYDAVGNIEQISHQRFGTQGITGNGWTKTFTNDPLSNQLQSTHLGCRTDAPVESYQYNAHGSIVASQHLPLIEWNYAEQLSHVNLQGGGDAYYVYDSSGQRVRKVWEKSVGLTEERIYFSGWEIYRKRQNENVTLERETLHVMDDQNRIAIVETQLSEQGVATPGSVPVIRFQLSNHQATARLELGAQAELISYEEFHPYGSTAYHYGIESTEYSAKRYRYTGKERDEETGFSYHGARYLMSSLGRWCSTDPIGIGDGLNMYAYCRGNPINLKDGTGTSAEADGENELARGLSYDPSFRYLTREQVIENASREWAANKMEQMRAELIEKKLREQYFFFEWDQHNEYWGYDFLYNERKTREAIELGYFEYNDIYGPQAYSADNPRYDLPEPDNGPLIEDPFNLVISFLPWTPPGFLIWGLLYSPPAYGGRIPVSRQLAGPTGRGYATKLRNSPGVAHGVLSTLTRYDKPGKWMRAGGLVARGMPLQIAEQMVGKKYASFAKFREEFWQLVAKDPILSQGWSSKNRSQMAKGKSPGTRFGHRTFGKSSNIYHLEHIKEIQDHGAYFVYNLNNIRVVSPFAHFHKFSLYAPLRPIWSR
ncbi:MAG: SpvB/TcaC N-terminal domain-containing protein [Pseudomonadota bacterium]